MFRISKDDLPVYFGHWIGSTSNDEFKKPITTLSEFGKAFRKEIIWRKGATISDAKGITEYDAHKNYQKLREEAIAGDAKEFINRNNDLNFMNFTLEDYQIVLSNSITTNRIIKILPQGNEFGKILRKQKLEKEDWNP